MSSSDLSSDDDDLSDPESSIPDIESEDEQGDDPSSTTRNPLDYQFFYRYPRMPGQPHLGYGIEGPHEMDDILQMLLDDEFDLDSYELRQRRFCEWQSIDDPSNFPDGYVHEAERRHTENTSLRNLFLKFDADGSATIDREEMDALMEALQFPTPLNEKEFYDIAGDDAEIDFLELHEYLHRVAPNIVDEPMWYYIDAKGVTEGPCPQLCIRYWIDSGFFKPDTKVRHEEFPDYLTLGRNMKNFPDDWLTRAENGELENNARKEAEEREKARHIIWVQEAYSAVVNVDLLKPYVPQSVYDQEDAMRMRKNLPLKYNPKSHLFDPKIRIILDKDYEKWRFELYNSVKLLVSTMKEGIITMQQVEQNRIALKEMSKKDKRKQKRKKKKRTKSEGKGEAETVAIKEAPLLLDKKLIETLMNLIDPTGFISTNSMYTFGRVCTEEQIIEYLLHERIEKIEEYSNFDILRHRNQLQENREKEGKEGKEGNEGKEDKETTKRHQRNKDEGGIDFFIGGADALPCLFNYDVLREEKEKLQNGGKPKKYKFVNEKCRVICAFLKETPMPFDKWIRIVRLHTDEEDGSAMALQDGGEESRMELEFDKWILAGSKEMYHFFRRVAQCPFRDFIGMTCSEELIN